MSAKPSATDRITRLHIRGLRSLADVTLDLAGLTVLIGENGSGKSSIVEACEVLRSLAHPGGSLQQVFEEHPSIVRLGGSSFEMGVTIEGDGPRIEYGFLIDRGPGWMAIGKELLDLGPIPPDTGPLHAILRKGRESKVFDQAQGKLVAVDADATRLLVSSYGSLPRREGVPDIQQRAIERVAFALQTIDVQLPFEVLPSWAAKRLGRRTAARESSMVRPAERLELLASNLTNVVARLKNDFGQQHWQQTLDYLRLGLGDDVDDVTVIPDASGGHHALAVRYKSLGAAVPASGLSDGTLAYLAFVAMLRLPSRRSLLACDEPDLHLHPALLTRVVGMLESIGRTCPVIVTTHSDRVLDTLREPARSVVLCELDEHRATRLLRPDGTVLAKWLGDFRGLGELRAAGLESAVMEPKEPPP